MPVDRPTEGDSLPPSKTIRGAERRMRHDARASYLVLALECDRPLTGSSRHCLEGIDEVVIGRGSGETLGRAIERSGRELRISVPDRWISSAHARLLRDAGDAWTLVDAGSTNGARVNDAKVTETRLGDGDVVELGRTMFVFREWAHASDEGSRPDAVVPGDGSPLDPVDPLATLDVELSDHFAALIRVARSELPVLVHGESGTGKELIARAVHDASSRPGAFTPVNCGALPPTIVESELFGCRKGAFSGATEDRLGLVRASEHGTLLLDEIGDLPLAAQAALLRVLQEREVLPVGATRAIRVDLRVVAATHRDLDALVRDGTFRGDLLARLAGFTLELPPLRERRVDMGILVSSLLRKIAAPNADLPPVTFGLEVGRALFRHEWPFNIRALDKALGAAVALAGGGRIEAEHLPEGVRAPRPSDVARASDAGVALSREELLRREHLVELLREHRGNVSAVARAMGKARMQVQRWMRRYGLTGDEYRS